MKKKNIKIKIATEADIIKTMKKVSREIYGFEAPKTFKNKKKYNRKLFKKVLLDD